jgi:hypothetical protein
MVKMCLYRPSCRCWFSRCSWVDGFGNVLTHSCVHSGRDSSRKVVF